MRIPLAARRCSILVNRDDEHSASGFHEIKLYDFPIGGDPALWPDRFRSTKWDVLDPRNGARLPPGSSYRSPRRLLLVAKSAGTGVKRRCLVLVTPPVGGINGRGNV